MRGSRLFTSIFIASVAACANAGDNCQAPGNVARVDDRNERLFVIASESDIAGPTKIEKIVEGAGSYIAACRRDWSSKWSVSAFSDKKYAAYKDEPQVAPYIENGEWQKAYLAEYDNSDASLVRFPLQPTRRVQTVLKKRTQ